MSPGHAHVMRFFVLNVQPSNRPNEYHFVILDLFAWDQIVNDVGYFNAGCVVRRKLDL